MVEKNIKDLKRDFTKFIVADGTSTWTKSCLIVTLDHFGI